MRTRSALQSCCGEDVIGIAISFQHGEHGVGVQHAFLYDALSRSQRTFKVNNFVSVDFQIQVFI